MIRALKLICTVNLVLSVILYAVYVIYFLSNGIDIDQHWGIVKHGRHGPTWALVAFLEIQFLVIFVAGRFSDKPQSRRLRLAYILWGILVLLFISGTANQSGSILLKYISSSAIAYGLLGSEDT